MTESEITVVVPVWDDYQRFLPRALASIEEQGVACEILIYDNASTPPVLMPEKTAGVTPPIQVPGEAAEAAKPLGEPPTLVLPPEGVGHGHPPITKRIIRSETSDNIGVARNKALAAVQTEFVCFHDADDLLLSGALAFALAQHKRRYLASVALQSLCADGLGHYWRVPTPLWQPLTNHLRPLMIWRSLKSNILAFGGCCLLRSSCVREAGGFSDIPSGEEMPLNIALALGWPCRWYRRFGRLYMVRPGSLWHREFTTEELRSMHDARLEPFADTSSPWAGICKARLRQRAERQIKNGVSARAAPGKEVRVSPEIEAWAGTHLISEGATEISIASQITSPITEVTNPC